jgi:ribosome recycling factor
MPNAPRPGRLKIVPPSLTDEQRREYVKYKEDNEGNLI